MLASSLTDVFKNKELTTTKQSVYLSWTLSDLNLRERFTLRDLFNRLNASVQLDDYEKIEESVIDVLPEVIKDHSLFDSLSKLYLKYPNLNPLMRVLLTARLRAKHILALDEVDYEVLALLCLDSSIGYYWRKNEQTYEGISFSNTDEIIVETAKSFFRLPLNGYTKKLKDLGIGSGKNGFHFKNRENCRIGAGGQELFFIDQKKYTTDSRSSSAGASTTKSVSIIIPVYKGLSKTSACIESVLRSECLTKFDITIINDSSPDEPLTRLIRRLSNKTYIKVIERPFNGGFISSVNLALENNTDNDIILLNADTVVFDGWIDKLREIANKKKIIGTVSALSNFAELASFPVPMVNNQLTASTAKDLDKILSNFASKPISVPVGVGHCIYIKRGCLNEVRQFNEYQLIRGYGEETEFCLRASLKGWQHQLATNLFVYHAGNVSFGSEKQALAKINVGFIHHHFPEHRSQYDAFLRQHPLKELSQQVQKKWLPQILSYNKNKVRVVFGSSLSNPYLESTILFNEPCIQIDAKIINGQQKFLLKAFLIEGLDAIEFKFDELDLLISQLMQGEISKIDISTTSALTNQQLFKLSQKFIFDCYLEDYRLYCPRRYLQQRDAKQCSDPADINECINCIDLHGSLVFSDQSLIKDREIAEALLKKANKVYATHPEISQRHAKRWPSAYIETKQAASKNLAQSNGCKRVIIPSIKSINEGFADFLNQTTHSNNTHYFIHGSVLNEKILNQFENVHLIRNIYHNESLLDLAKRYKFDAVADYSNWIGAPKRWSVLAEKLNVPLISINQKDAMYV